MCILGRRFRGLPKVHLHNPVLAYETGDEFMKFWYQAEEGLLDPFVDGRGRLNPKRKDQIGRLLGRSGNRLERTGQPITTCEWIDRLAPKAFADDRLPEPAPLMAGSTPCREIRPARWDLADYLGWNWRSKAGLPIINVPGCPVQPDNFMETLLYLLYQAAGIAPMIPLDEQLRPTWLFGKTVHEGCDRAGYYEQGDFAYEYGSPKCLVKIGCWGPVVNCNVTKRGWMAGIGGCPNVGGICIACTMPGFPDKFMPFMDEPPGGSLSSTGQLEWYGRRSSATSAASPIIASILNPSGVIEGTGSPPAINRRLITANAHSRPKRVFEGARPVGTA